MSSTVDATTVASVSSLAVPPTVSAVRPTRRATSSVVLRSDGTLVAWRDGVVTMRASILERPGWYRVLRGTGGRVAVFNAGEARTWDVATWTESVWSNAREAAPTADGFWNATDDEHTSFELVDVDGSAVGVRRDAGESVLLDAAMAGTDPVARTVTPGRSHPDAHCRRPGRSR